MSRHLSGGAPVGAYTGVQPGMRAVSAIVQHEEMIRLNAAIFLRVIRRAGRFESHWRCECGRRGQTQRVSGVETALEHGYAAAGQHNVTVHYKREVSHG